VRKSLRGVAAGAGLAGVLSLGGFLVFAHGPGDTPADDGSTQTGPVPGAVHTIALRALSKSAPGRVMGTRATSTEPFSLLGVTWTDAAKPLHGTVEVRTRSEATGRWSPWQAVAVGGDDSPNPAGRERSPVRGATAPLWVGPSNGVEVKVDGRRTLPTGLRVDLVDPGSHRAKRRSASRTPSHGMAEPMAATESAGPAPSASDSASSSAPPTSPQPTGSAAPSDAPSTSPSVTPPSPSGTASPTPSPTAPAVSTAPRPAIVPRAQWGADESIVKGPPTYDSVVKAVFVHHTDTGNSYTCAQSASVVRSVFLYHVQSNGWDDIGYNFLVDKCGTIFEGRAGGVDRPVHGAHTYGFNTDTAGVAILGTYSSATASPPGVAPTKAALDAVARISAWKLGLDKRDPAGKVELTEMATSGGKYPYGTKVTLNAISGHRDGYATECPGQQVYTQLPTVRTAAKQWTTPATTPFSTSVSGANLVGTTYYTKAGLTLSWKQAAVTGYQVLVDGAVKATPAASATSQTITLSPGTHTVQLKAANIDGTSATSNTYRVIADATRPVFSSPAALSIRTGTVSSTAVPVRLGWKVTDDRLLQSVKATSPKAVTFGTTTTSWSYYAKPSTATTWALSAADAAGNTATSSVSRTTALTSESYASRHGTWYATSTSSYLGSHGLYSRSKGASLSWTFTGRSVGLIVKRSSSFGAFYVYVDGYKVATVDSKYSTTQYRQLIWTKTWSSSATHTVKIVVAGTSGRPTVASDGIAYIK
jgi:uncharacterized protein with LGFP repeats